MKIISKIRRQQTDKEGVVLSHGSVIEMGKDRERKYHFKPDADGHHVCDVTPPEDIAAFLKIEEGFEVHPDELRKSKQSAKTGTDPDAGDNDDGAEVVKTATQAPKTPKNGAAAGNGKAAKGAEAAA